MKEALENKDRALFLRLINESRKSSTDLLKNMMVMDNYEGSPLQACDRAMKIMKKEGACKINGGGFGGSIICIVPTNLLEQYLDIMKKKYGDKHVFLVNVLNEVEE